MNKLRWFGLAGAALIGIVGCDTARVDRLEKENAALKAKVDKADVARDYDLKAKCAKDSRQWFNENYSRNKDTIFLDFTTHYNAKFNTCMILVENHYKSQFAREGGNSWTNDVNLFDIYENGKYASFAENHITNLKPTMETHEEVISCEVEGNKCKTTEEFYNLVRPYMND